MLKSVSAVIAAKDIIKNATGRKRYSQHYKAVTDIAFLLQGAGSGLPGRKLYFLTFVPLYSKIIS